METNKSTNSKVLFITYYWPPSGGAGVQRSLKFVKYLKLLGKEPIVLTVNALSATYPLIDNSLVGEIQNDVKVFTTKSFEPLKILSSFFGKDKIPHGGFSNSNKESISQKVLRWIRGNFFIPDARVGWNWFALKEAIEIINSETINYVLISSPPHSSQLIGVELKKRFPHIRLVVDLRDPWTDIYYYKDLLHTKIAANIDKNYECKVLENADAILVVSDDIKRNFLKKSEHISEDKIHVLPNGYDESDFTADVIREDTVFTISYVGTISEIYNPKIFFSAISNILIKDSNLKIKIRFVGSAPSSVKNLVNLFNLESICEWIPHVDHKTAINFMRTSDLLLLIIPDNPGANGILTGKLFEYIGANVPILGIGPTSGDAAKILIDCGAGKMFRRDQEDEMKIWLLNLIYKAQTESKYVKQISSNSNQYSRLNLTKRLSDIIFNDKIFASKN